MLFRALSAALLLACAALAQQTPLPANWAGAGAAYSAASKPPVAGWFSYATLISDKAQLYSFSTHDIFLSPAKPYTIMTSVRSGLATPVRTIGKCSSTCLVLLGLGDAGIAGGGSSVGGAFSGGGIGVLKLGKTNWTLAAGGRVVNAAGGSQTVYELGVGRIF